MGNYQQGYRQRQSPDMMQAERELERQLHAPSPELQFGGDFGAMAYQNAKTATNNDQEVELGHQSRGKNTDNETHATKDTSTENNASIDSDEPNAANDDAAGVDSSEIGDKDSDIESRMDYEDEDEDDEDSEVRATWSEVVEVCCSHTPMEWVGIFFGVLVLCFFLYFFLLGLELLGRSAKIVGGCTAGSLLGDSTNPVAGLLIGILATVLLQSSSTATSIIVSLVGADILSARQAIYMVMGANIGTSVTNTIVAMGFMSDLDQLERAFAGATVHDMFNFLSVAVLLPVEVVTGYLYYVTKAMVSGVELPEGDTWEGPVAKLVKPLTAKIIVPNKDVFKAVANGDSCDSFYPIQCDDPANPTYSTCNVTGIIACDKKTGQCPAFFQVDASNKTDKVSGGICLVIALLMLIICLVGLITVLQRMLLGISAHIVVKATKINGYLAMVVGTGMTILLQSSSITTSTLTPLVGVGAIPLQQMYALTLGCNIGTTVTALLAALVSERIESLQVALAHLVFNITGILIWYPVPIMRNIPIHAAVRLGQAARYWRPFPIFYITFMFFLTPLGLLALSSLFEQDDRVYVAVGLLLVVLLFASLTYLIYWWYFQSGRDKCVARMAKKKQQETEPETQQESARGDQDHEAPANRGYAAQGATVKLAGPQDHALNKAKFAMVYN